MLNFCFFARGFRFVHKFVELFKKRIMKKIDLLSLKSKFRKGSVVKSKSETIKIDFKQSEYKEANPDQYKKNYIKAYEYLANTY